jgi:zinc protease
VRRRPQEPEPRAARQVVLADPRVAQPSLRRSYLVPSYGSAAPGEAEALDVLAQILGHGAIGRLYRVLVVEKGIANSAGGWYLGSALDPSRLAVYATPRPGVTLPTIEAALDSVLADVIDKGVTEQELTRAKTRMIADVTYEQDSQSSLARVYGVALTTGWTVEQVRTWPDRIRAVTAEAVRAAARRFLDKRRSVTGYLVKDGAGGAEASQ